MNDIREMLKHAYQLDDEARQDFEEYQERKRRDNLLLTKSSHQGLIYKTFESRPTTMSEEDSRGWNSWLRNALDRFRSDELMPLFEVLAGELGACSGKAERQQNEKIKALEERVRTLESLLMSKGINVVELRKGRSDAAA